MTPPLRHIVTGVVGLAGAALIAGILVGGADLSPGVLWQVLNGGGTEADRSIVLALRLPRALLAFACGALLAQSGALLQAVLRNPLADPYVLGVSGAAAAACIAALLLGWGQIATFGAGLVGAAIAGSLVLYFGRGGPSGWEPFRVILAGAAIAAGSGAVLSLLLVLAPNQALRGALFWLLGDLSGAARWLPLWLLLLGAGLGLQTQAYALNALSLSDAKAASLGVPVGRLQGIALAAAALLTVATVLACGTIGFVGLVAPHVLRFLGVSDYRWLLPLSALIGGGLLCLADAVARSAAAPAELPVGAVTALLGVPVLLLLLRRGA